MNTAEEITRILRTTLVVENNAGIKYATEKIQKVMVEFAKEALKNASENAKTEQGYCSDAWTPSVRIVDKQSILSESNIPKL